MVLHGATWAQYEALLALRGESAVPRMTYLGGELELMSPSLEHETLKVQWRRLLEAYADEAGIELNGYGSWTVRSRPRARGVEADECYVIGVQRPRVPDLALEVVWTRWEVDKLEVYRGLGVREVWVWREGLIEVNVLRRGRYQRAARSGLLPALDLAFLARFLGLPEQSRAVRAYRAALRRRPQRRPR